MAFGDGLAQLLQEIGKRGSINRAAAALKMSYREAWGRIKKAEDRLGIALLIKQIGGDEGGGAQLTPGAQELLRRYGEFRDECDLAVRRIYRKHFGDVR